MLLQRTGILLLFSLAFLPARAQKNEQVSAYISQYRQLAMAEMNRTGVPAAITLAQGIHESGAGKSELARASNNHFGIKCKSNWTGESVRHDDDAKGECFRKYPSPEDSYKDHSDFLRGGQRYASLFTLDPEDYKGWANGLKKAGYATNPRYPEVLIKLIEDYELQNYTLLALGKKQAGANGTVASETAIPDAVATSVLTERTEPVSPAYPEGVFRINETKVVFAQKGMSWLGLATRYEVDLARLFEFNDMAPAESIAKDQLVFLQRKRRTGNNDYHLVLPGESLHDIAQKEAIRLESLKELNWLRGDDQPAPGEKLSLKERSTVMPRLKIKDNNPLAPPFPGSH